MCGLLLSVLLTVAGCGTGKPTFARGTLVSYKPTIRETSRCGSGGPYVSRIVAVAGDRVSVRDGYVYIDGKLRDGTYARDAGGPAGAATLVPKNSVYVVNDDRATGCDSRVWGPLPVASIIAKTD